MKPQRPYFLRALYDWIVDSGEVPYLLVDATGDGVNVPSEHVEEGKIVLNISPEAVRELDLGRDHIACSGRFGGKPYPIYVPMASIKAIYCKGSGHGMAFEAEDFPDAPHTDPQDKDRSDKPGLRLV